MISEKINFTACTVERLLFTVEIPFDIFQSVTQTIQQNQFALFNHDYDIQPDSNFFSFNCHSL